jgi:hypothetical protein
VRIMVGKKAKSYKGKQGKPTKRSGRTGIRAVRKAQAQPKQIPKVSRSTIPNQHITVHPSQSTSVASRPVFSIKIGSIGGDTTIGDLIVAFPRTRDVLVKHGLRFDVEEAGYLYMTLNVFSAIHGLTSNSLVQELHAASKESPPQPTQPQLRPVITPQTA